MRVSVLFYDDKGNIVGTWKPSEPLKYAPGHATIEHVVPIPDRATRMAAHYEYNWLGLPFDPSTKGS